MSDRSKKKAHSHFFLLLATWFLIFTASTMAEKMSRLVLEVDLSCSRCYKKVKKILCKYPEIRDQVYDEKKNTVTITGPFCPHKLAKKLCCKAGKSIKTIEIVDIPKPKPPEKAPEPAPKAPEPAPKAPEPAPKAPEPAPKAPEPAPKAPEPAPKAPEPAPKAPEPAPKKPEPKKIPVVAVAVQPLGICCGPCSQGYGGGPCFQGYGRAPSCYDAYGRPLSCCGVYGTPLPYCDGYGRSLPCHCGCGGYRGYRRGCDYFSEENPSCTIM